MDFSETDTETAIKSRIVESLRVDTARNDIKSVKGFVSLTTNEAKFMDTWYTWYPDAS